MNGGVDAAEAPLRRPELDVGIFFWHPQGWDIHLWTGDHGVPAVVLANASASGSGLPLPDGSFFYLENGRKQIVREPRQR